MVLMSGTKISFDAAKSESRLLTKELPEYILPKGLNGKLRNHLKDRRKMEYLDTVVNVLVLFVLGWTLYWVWRYAKAAEETKAATYDLARAAAESNKLTSKLAEASVDP